MNKKTLLFTILLTLAFAGASAQSINSATPVRNFYYDYKLSNPAFTGTNAKHAITTAYAGDDSGFGYSKLAYGSYEANLKFIQSGVGVISSVQEVGIFRFTHYGLLYSKKITLNDQSGFYVGTQLAYQRTRIDFTKVRVLIPDDPLIDQPGIEKSTGFNLALGVAYYSPQVTLGAGFKNVLKQDNETREFNFVATRDFKVSNKVKATPSLLFVTDSDYNSVRLNNSFELFQWVLVGAGYTFPRNNGRDNLDINVGANIKDWVQIITHIYASEYNRGDRNNREGSWMETMIRVRIGDLKKDGS